LDNLYGSGIGASPHLYDQQNGGGIKFLIEETGTPGKSDLPRNSQMIALLGDPRNDENLIISQLHLAFLRFHMRLSIMFNKSCTSSIPRKSSAKRSESCAGIING